MHDPSIHFLDERLLMRQTSDTLFVAYQNLKEDGQFYTDNTLFTICLLNNTGSLKYFLAVLNSKLTNYIYKYLSMEEGKILAQVKTALVEEIPVKYDPKKEKEIVAKVDAILELRRANPGCDVLEIESEIDELVCDMYGLSNEEKALVLNINQFKVLASSFKKSDK